VKPRISDDPKVFTENQRTRGFRIPASLLLGLSPTDETTGLILKAYPYLNMGDMGISIQDTQEY
jgi:uncharacterized protein (DUF433 family)